jgi:hypothetical protein
MKTIITMLLTVVCMFCFSFNSFAADPVDLTGKKGIVDPKDLKKDNPKHEKLQKTTPPSPSSGSSDNKRPFGQGSYGVAK